MKITFRMFSSLTAALLYLAAFAIGQTTTFTYQGQLLDNSMPANASYEMQFRLYDTPVVGTGTQQGITYTPVLPIQVTGGSFSVQLDFGPVFASGADLYLEISLRPAGGQGYTTLGPRQRVTSSPYSNRALVAGNAFNLGGVPAGDFVQTTDPRLSDARQPLPGSGSYIQNSNTLQPSSSFNVSGNGTVGQDLTVDTNTFFVDATNNRVGIGTITPTNFLSFSGEDHRTIGNERRIVPNDSGRDLNITAGGASQGGSNRGGGSLILKSGIATGTGGSSILFQTPQPGSSGTDDRFPLTRMSINSKGDVVIGSFVSSTIARLDVERNAIVENTPNLGLRVANFSTNDVTSGFTSKYGAEIVNAGSVVNDSYGLTILNSSTNTAADARLKYGLQITSLGTFTGGAGADNVNRGIAVLVGGADINYAATFTGGHVGIGTTAPLERLHVTGGTVRVDTLGTAAADHICRNALNQLSSCSSSLRYKTGISNFRRGLDFVKRLRPITFNWKDTGRADLGLGAEDVERIEPLLVTYNDDGQVEGVKYDRIGVVLLNAVKEQQEQIERQQKQIDEQREMIEALRRLVCSEGAKSAACGSDQGTKAE